MPSMPTIRQGQVHPAVGVAQRCINAHGFGPLSLDDSFGPKTKAAVQQFQASVGLADDGVVGPGTWGQLRIGPGQPYIDAYLGTGASEGRRAEVAGVERQELVSLMTQQPHEHPAVPRVLRYAISHLGLREEPDGSNTSPRLAHLLGKDNAFRRYWLSLTAEGHKRYKAGQPLRPEDYLPPPPWCAIFISSTIALALDLGFWDPSKPGHKLQGHPFERWEGGALAIEDWGRAKGWIYKPDEHWPCGAAFVQGRDGSGSDKADTSRAGHTGYVVADLGDGTIRTLEGNTGNEVASLVREKRLLRSAVPWWRGLAGVEVAG